jgi:hypothetical protein
LKRLASEWTPATGLKAGVNGRIFLGERIFCGEGIVLLIGLGRL